MQKFISQQKSVNSKKKSLSQQKSVNSKKKSLSQQKSVNSKKKSLSQQKSVNSKKKSLSQEKKPKKFYGPPKETGGEWVLHEKIGEGAFGSVLIACHKLHDQMMHGDCKYVIKIQEFKDRKTHGHILSAGKIKEAFRNEVHFLTKLNNTSIVPHIYDAWICQNIGYIVMEKLLIPKDKKENQSWEDYDAHLTKKYFSKMQKTMKRLHQHKVAFMDFSHYNYGLRENTKEGVLLDFGLAVDFDGIPDGKKISHPYDEDYGKFSWEDAKEFDNLSVKANLGDVEDKKRAIDILGDMEL